MVKERERCHQCQYRSFSNWAKYPISVTNDVDEEALPYNFRFIETAILGADVEVPDEEFHTGCECEKDVDCMFKDCQCLQEMKETDADEHGKIYSYHSQGDRKECLRGAKLESRDPIYECHAGCACSSACSNRVVERGRKIPLNIFKTDDGRGWGTFLSLQISITS
jgi:histone-lysine N-methyltransferase SUV39H